MLTLEEDQLQDHKHDITDPGHEHGFDDKYASAPANGHMGPEGGNTGQDAWDNPHPSTSAASLAGVAVEGVAGAFRSGGETRPKNMNVIYIIRVW